MEDLGQLLFKKIKELVELEVQEIELKFAIFNNRALSKYNEKVELINENFIQQSKFYGKKVEDYENEKNDIIDKYNKEFQKIYDKRRIQYINIVNEIREMQSNQKIALANIENLYSEWDSLIDSKEQKEGSTNLFDEICGNLTQNAVLFLVGNKVDLVENNNLDTEEYEKIKSRNKVGMV